MKAIFKMSDATIANIIKKHISQTANIDALRLIKNSDYLTYECYGCSPLYAKNNDLYLIGLNKGGVSRSYNKFHRVLERPQILHSYTTRDGELSDLYSCQDTDKPLNNLPDLKQSATNRAKELLIDEVLKLDKENKFARAGFDKELLKKTDIKISFKNTEINKNTSYVTADSWVYKGITSRDKEFISQCKGELDLFFPKFSFTIKLHYDTFCQEEESIVTSKLRYVQECFGQPDFVQLAQILIPDKVEITDRVEITEAIIPDEVINPSRLDYREYCFNRSIECHFSLPGYDNSNSNIQQNVSRELVYSYSSSRKFKETTSQCSADLQTVIPKKMDNESECKPIISGDDNDNAMKNIDIVQKSFFAKLKDFFIMLWDWCQEVFIGPNLEYQSQEQQQKEQQQNTIKSYEKLIECNKLCNDGEKKFTGDQAQSYKLLE